MPENGVFGSVRGKTRGKTGKMDKEKALYPLKYKTFFMAEKEGFEFSICYEILSFVVKSRTALCFDIPIKSYYLMQCCENKKNRLRGNFRGVKGVVFGVQKDRPGVPGGLSV